MTQDRLVIRRVGTLALVAALTLGIGLAYSLQQDENGLSPEAISAAMDAIGVVDMSVQWISVPGEAVSNLDIPVTIEGRDYLLSLSQHSLRSPDFEVFQTDAAGDPIPAEIPDVRTSRGWVDGSAGSSWLN